VVGAGRWECPVAMAPKLATPDLSNSAWLRLVERAEVASEAADGDWERFQQLLKGCVASATELPAERAQAFAENFTLDVALAWDLPQEIVVPALEAVRKYELPEILPFRLAAEL
jgi:hypothetical protein